MDEREIEQGYANFHRMLNRVLRERDVKKFKEYLSRHPTFVGKLSRCFGLNDDLIEVEMYKAILIRPSLKDLHPEAIRWLRARNIELPEHLKRKSRFLNKRRKMTGRY